MGIVCCLIAVVSHQISYCQPRRSEPLKITVCLSILMEKSQCRVDKSVLLLKESIAIETLQYQYTGTAYLPLGDCHREDSQNKKSERHALPFGIRPI